MEKAATRRKGEGQAGCTFDKVAAIGSGSVWNVDVRGHGSGRALNRANNA
jgi:hypothetical protein